MHRVQRSVALLRTLRLNTHLRQTKYKAYMDSNIFTPYTISIPTAIKTISTSSLSANANANRHDILDFTVKYEPKEIDDNSKIFEGQCYYECENVEYGQDEDSDKYWYIEEGELKPSTESTDIIKNCLLGIEQTGFFSCGGSINGAILPRIYINGIGDIGLPLVNEQAQLVINKCKMAPFGRKEERIIDTNIRKTWQMEPSQFTIKNPSWDQMVKNLVKHVCDKLVCDPEKVNHVLYKLLIYEPGSFFKPHRDSEKEHGMFGTLAVVLPNPYSGGQLIIHHNNKVCEYDFGDRSELLETTFTAFYADCEHEIKPVTTGIRICLVYNLVNTSTDILPAIKEDTDSLQKLINSINNWVINPDDYPGLLVYGLEHRYTDAGLSFSGLKGKDVAVARMLKTVSENIPLNLYLVNMERTVYLYEDPYSEESTTITTWVSATGQIDPEIEAIPIRQENMVQKQFWKDKTKDEVDAEHMGNEPAHISRLYHHTGIVFWPPQVKHHKYIGGSLLDAIEYMKTLKEESDIREVALLIIRKLNNFATNYSSNNLLYDLYEILFRYNLSDQVAVLTNFVMNIDRSDKDIAFSKERNIDAIKRLSESYPTLTTNPTFITLVTSAKRKLDLEIAEAAGKDWRWKDRNNICKKEETVVELEKILSNM